MTFIGHAFVDWDDTIAENIRYFNQVESDNSQLIARVTGDDPATICRRGQELNVAVARRMGLVHESFPTAWVQCYHEFASSVGAPCDGEVEQAIRVACRIPYEIRQELLPGAAETVAWLHGAGFEVTIWTAGEHAIQHRKVWESGLAHLLHRTEVVIHKSPEQLALALGQRDRSRCFVVGNSMHSDIWPALALGIKAFHVPTETWGYDHKTIDFSDPQYTGIASIADLPAALVEAYELQAGGTSHRSSSASR